ncbi:MAG: hypothetical protein K0V04_33935 [Deltaproteobacteria bacterium]|nr:hypothetical protein [Deltaproteobacteria bacterium]
MIHTSIVGAATICSVPEVPSRPDRSAPPTAAPRHPPLSWHPRRFTTGFTLGYLLSLSILGTVSVVWLIGMVATTSLWLWSDSGVGPVVAFAITGGLLGWGWIGLLHTLRRRLRTPDLSEPPALPPGVAALPPGLRRWIGHTRSLMLVVHDPELSPMALDRELFEWIGSMTVLAEDDQHWVRQRGLVPARLRSLVHDNQRAASGRPSMAARREHAAAVLAWALRTVIQPPGDPFRGGRSFSSVDATNAPARGKQ